jgi:cytoskeleton protein RodZ
MNGTMPIESEKFDAAELGAMMREMRENLGQDLSAVAEDLRIRLVYLEAIEAGRLSDLPGSAYVSGFLRAYSDYLGLDGEEIVRRFKMAGVEISSKAPLQLLSPVEEGRLPTVSILLVAAVIAGGAYGGWHYLSIDGRSSIEGVANLPKELSELVEGAKIQTAPVAAPAQVSEQQGSLAPASAEPAPRPAAAALPVTLPQTAAVPPPATDAPLQPASRIDQPRSEADRIVVHAIDDSYVAVLAADNEPLFSQLMRPGDSYEVPSGTDLVLETGNAGGLQITVGGQRAPPLGDKGQIRKNIPLDAQKLLSGSFR